MNSAEWATPATAAVDDLLGTYLNDKAVAAEVHGQRAVDAIILVRGAAVGGKRARTACVYWGWTAAGRSDATARVLTRAAAACELLHCGACTVDDVLDGSVLRRGRPSVWRHYAAEAQREGWIGDASNYGRQMALLLGTLTLSWGSEVFATACAAAPAEHAANARTVWSDLLSDAWAGQTADLRGQAERGVGVEASELVRRARHLARVKTRYAFTHPLLLGAALGGGSTELLSALRDFGDPVAEAFQIRDDVLGVFGHPEIIGKPTVDDIREGQQTVLVALARERASADELQRLNQLVGHSALDEVDANEVRQIMESTGARAATERIIDRLVTEADVALATRPAMVAVGAAASLRELAVRAAYRDR